MALYKSVLGTYTLLRGGPLDLGGGGANFFYFQKQRSNFPLVEIIMCGKPKHFSEPLSEQEQHSLIIVVMQICYVSLRIR